MIESVWSDLYFQLSLSGGLASVLAATVWLRRPIPALPTAWLLTFCWPAYKLLSAPRDGLDVARLNLTFLLPSVAAVCVSRKPKARRRMLLGILAAFGIFVTYRGGVAVCRYGSGGWAPAMTRWSGGVFLSSNHLAAAAAACGLGLLCFAARDVGLRPWRAAIASAGAIWFIALTIVTCSRGATAAVVVGTVPAAALLGAPRSGRVLLLFAGALTAVAAVTYGPSRSRVIEVANAASAPAQVRGAPLGQTERFGLGRAILSELKGSWWRGVTKADAQRGLRARRPSGRMTAFYEGYCSHLNWAWRYGVVAALASLTIMLLGTISGLRNTSVVVGAASGACLVFLLNSLTTDIWQHQGNLAVHHLLAALLLLEACETRRLEAVFCRRAGA